MARARLMGTQQVTINRTQMVKSTPLNEFGDEPLFGARDSTGFSLPIQVEWGSRRYQGGIVEQTPSVKAVGTALYRDVLNSEQPDWQPQEGDLVTLVEGDALYVQSPRPAYPLPQRRGCSTFPYQGWVFDLVDRWPEEGRDAR